ncbi:MAG: transcription termination/antitermination factor NusG [Clostridia bacterium]|nr:transcription termination/antitermination factor NusG [Clostridia bacterium]
MNESGEFRWYVAHTYSGYENKVKDNIEKTVENRNLQDLIAEVCIPTEEVKSLVKKKKKTAGKTTKRKKSNVSEEEIFDADTALEGEEDDYEIVEKVLQRKLYPGYVFVKMIMTSESWYIVRNTRGCTGFVGPESKPVPLTESEVYSLGVEKIEINIPFEEGDSVRISGGSFEGYMGEIRAIDKDRLKITVMVTMFGGREMELEVDLNEVEAL